MSSKINAPWESEECFPEKPAGQPYGYMEREKLVGCSLEELTNRCAGLKLPEVELIWHPEAPRLVSVWTVPMMQESLKTREKATLKHNRNVAAFIVLVYCAFGIATWHNKSYLAMVSVMSVLFGFVPLYQNWRALRQFDQLVWDFSKESETFDRYAAWVETRSSAMTWALLAIISAVGLAQVYSDLHYRLPVPVLRSVFLAGLVKELVGHGQWWRLGTGTLLHGNDMHFILNAFALLGLGRLTEALASPFRLATIFIVSALGGSLLSLYLAPHTTSVGASGGLMGLIGFLLVVGYRRRALLPPNFIRIFIMNVGLVLVMGVVAWRMVDNAAHLGGFACGAIAASLMVPPVGPLPLPDTRISKTIGLLSFSTILGFALLAIWKILGKF